MLSHPVNLGQAAALQTGIELRGAAFIVTFDADGQHRAADIGSLLDALTKYHVDFALGSLERVSAIAIGNLSFLAALAGLDFVWVPSHATRLAEWAGVGRGVDLVIYIWVVISWLLLLNLHLKMRVQFELITALARTIAISNAQRALSDDIPSNPSRVPSSGEGLATLE